MDWYSSIGVKSPVKIDSLSDIGKRRNENLKDRIEVLVNPLINAFPFELWSIKK